MGEVRVGKNGEYGANKYKDGGDNEKDSEEILCGLSLALGGIKQNIFV